LAEQQGWIKSRNGDGYSSFEVNAFDYVSGTAQEQAQVAHALALNREPRFKARFAELAAFGVWPKVVSYSEMGGSHLMTMVEFDASGRRALVASPIWKVWWFVRPYLQIIYWAIALCLVLIALGERIWKSNGAYSVISIIAVIAVIFLGRRLSRKALEGK
jgi:hypothetical protein